MILRARTLLPFVARRIKVRRNNFEIVRELVERIPLGMSIARMRRQIDHGSVLGISHADQCHMPGRRKSPPTAKR
ncbi:hypothetical protein BO226_11125 [Rhodococcus sp. 2G]|nr:hypothetical protein BO226_11125 [Rhodococcus sp. 2G]